MTTTVRTTAANRIPMTSLRKTALVAGVFYLITFISIPTLALYGPVKNHRDWILSSGSHTGVFVAARILEAAMIFTGVISLLSLLTLRQDLGGAAGANAAALVTSAASHVG